jgi:hypothetical protein
MVSVPVDLIETLVADWPDDREPIDVSRATVAAFRSIAATLAAADEEKR